MRAGGKLTSGLWLTRIHSLRPGDYVKCAHWSGEIWMSGEALLVRDAPVRLPKTIDRPAGYFDIVVQVPTDPLNWRVLCALGDDQIQLTARDTVREEPAAQRPRKQKPKKGEQLKLFGED